MAMRLADAAREAPGQILTTSRPASDADATAGADLWPSVYSGNRVPVARAIAVLPGCRFTEERPQWAWFSQRSGRQWLR